MQEAHASGKDRVTLRPTGNRDRSFSQHSVASIDIKILSKINQHPIQFQQTRGGSRYNRNICQKLRKQAIGNVRTESCGFFKHDPVSCRCPQQEEMRIEKSIRQKGRLG